jgi:putative spermidine/putrescine transport system permease protein
MGRKRKKYDFINLSSKWLPATLGWFVLLFLIVPSLIVIPMSFGDKDELIFPPTTWSLYLYKQYFTQSGWMAVTFTSLRVAIWVTLSSLTLGVLAAYALVRGSFPGKRFLTLFLLSPIMIPSVVVALGLYLYFVDIGISGGELRLVLGHIVVTMPFVIVTAMAGLRHVDPYLEIAATIMGANRLTVLWKVTLPLLKPALIGGGLFAFLLSFDEVVIAWFVSRAGSQTLPVKMYSSIQWELSPVLAAISALLTLLSLIICVVVSIYSRKESDT